MLELSGELPLELNWGNTAHKYQGRTVKTELLDVPKSQPLADADPLEVKAARLVQLVLSLAKRPDPMANASLMHLYLQISANSVGRSRGLQESVQLLACSVQSAAVAACRLTLEL